MRINDLRNWEQYPCVTYHVLRRDYAEGRKERRPRDREMFGDDKDPEQFVVLRGQFFDYTVCFSVWGRNNDEADALLDKLEDFLLIYTPYFKQNGVNQFWFEQQLEDEVETSWRIPVYVRRVNYLLRLERIVVVRVEELNRVLINVNVKEE